MNLLKEKKQLASAGILLFLVLAVYYPVVNARLVNMDDVEMLMHLNNNDGDISLNHLFFPEGVNRYYRPFHLLSFYLDYKVWQQEDSGYHLTNYLLHACNALLFFSILLELCRRLCIKYSFVVPCALIFALHPLTCESVAWVSGRTDIIASFFCFIALRLYLTDLYIKYLFFPVLLLLGLLAKESALILVPLILMIDVAFLWYKKMSGRQILQSACIWGLVMIPGLLFYLRMRMGGLDSLDQGVQTALTNKVAMEGGLWFQNLEVWLFHFFASTGFYIKKLFFPFPLNFAIYQISSLSYFIFSLLLIILAGLFIYKKKYLFPFWYILVVMSFLPALFVATAKIAWTAYAERYLYFSCAVFSAGIFYIFSLLAENFKIIRFKILIFLWLVIVIFGISTLRRTFVWENDMTLWESTIRESPYYGKAMFKYGEALQANGKKEEGLRMFYNIVETARDDEWKSYALVKLGREANSRQRYDEALNFFQKSLLLHENKYIHEAIAQLYFNLPCKSVDEKKKNHEKTIFHYQQVYKYTGDPFYLYLMAKMKLSHNEIDAKNLFSEITQKYPGSHLADLSHKILRSLQLQDASQVH